MVEMGQSAIRNGIWKSVSTSSEAFQFSRAEAWYGIREQERTPGTVFENKSVRLAINGLQVV